MQGLALDAVARLANAVGKPFERSARLFVAPICGILADAKATVRAPALVALSAIHDQCGLECMITQVACGLEPVNPLQRSELASWLSTRLATAEAQVDLAPLVGPVVACLEDKSGDVRKAAQSLLPAIISSVGFERLMDRASALKPASRSVVIPMLETAKAAGSDRATASGSTLPVTDGAASLTKPLGHRTTIAGAASIASKGLPAVTRSLRPSAPGTGNDSVRGPNPLSRPVSSSSSASAPGSSNRNATHMSHPSARSTQRPSSGDGGSRLNITAGRSLFRASDASGKQNRAGRETGALRWLVEDTARPDQIEYLQQQMISHTSPELMALMFSRDHNSARDHAEALTLLTALSRSASYDELEASTPEQQEDRSVLLANSDLVLKYITIRLCDHSSSIVLGCLDLVEALFHAMLSARYYMTDYEASCFLPSIVAKVRRDFHMRSSKQDWLTMLSVYLLIARRNRRAHKNAC